MARTRRGAELTEENRLDQVRLGDSLVGLIVSLVRRLIDADDLRGSALRFAREAAPEVLRYREASRLFEIDYLAAFQRVECPEAAHEPVDLVDDDFDVVDAIDDLLVAARIAGLKASKRGATGEEIVKAVETATAGRARRLAGDGGRQVAKAYVDHGRGPIGYVRVVDRDPCAFCAMLASRGVTFNADTEGAGLYKSDSFRLSNSKFEGAGRFKVHDHCECTLEPVYRVDKRLKFPGATEELARQWAQVAAGTPDPMGYWRRWIDSGTLPEDYEGDLEGVRRPAPGAGGSTTVDAVPTEKRGGRAGWGEADYLEEIGRLRERNGRIQDEIQALKDAGISDHDLTLRVLEEESSALLSRIDRYSAAASKMGSR